MKYELKIRDIEADDVYEFKIDELKDMVPILECFKNKIIEVDLHKLDKTRKLGKKNG